MRPRNEILPARQFLAIADFLFQVLDAAQRVGQLVLHLLKFCRGDASIQAIFLLSHLIKMAR